MTPKDTLCSQDILDALVSRLGAGGGVSDIEEVITQYPHDARLHFLKGSVLAGDRRYEDAISAIKDAVDLAPDYDIARFQLGFLQFTSGDAGAAELTWAPFIAGDRERPLAVFAAGLLQLTIDDTPGAIATLKHGIARNTDYPALNADIGLLVAELKANFETPSSEPTSETDMLLWQFGQGSRH